MALLFNFNFFKRTAPNPPAEVVQAACNVYGITPERVSSIQAERLNALSDNIWVIKLSDDASAVVAYMPETKERTIAAPWFSE